LNASTRRSTRSSPPDLGSGIVLPAALLVAALLLSGPAGAQVGVDWVAPTAGVAIAVDAANNVYTANYVYALGAEITVTRRDVNGQLQWQRSFDQTDPGKWEVATWMTTDSAGNAIVSGTMKSGYSNPVDAASLVMKWAPDGTLLWRRVYESSFDGSFTKRCLVDGDDNVYVLGMGSGPAGYVTKVKKFSPDGEPMWTWFDADGIGAPVIFKLTPDDHLVISARSIYGSVNGYAKIDLDGQRVWAFPGVDSLSIGDVAGDAAGNAYLVHGEWALQPRTQVRKLGPSGALLWDRLYDLSGNRVEVGRDGNVVVSGFPDSGTYGAAFIKLDPQGDLLWANLDADGPLGLLLHAQLLLDERDDAFLAAGTLFEMAVCKVRGEDGGAAWTQTVPGSYSWAMALGPHDRSVFVVGGTTARLLDETGDAWLDLGLGLSGANGIPLLHGDGDLVAGNPLSLTLNGAAPSSPATLVIGLTALLAPFKGGTLVPDPLLLLPLGTGPNGGFSLSATWPAGVPAGTGLYLQVWLPDAGADLGWAASNGLQALSG
jgi:hypothetical protein